MAVLVDTVSTGTSTVVLEKLTAPAIDALTLSFDELRKVRRRRIIFQNFAHDLNACHWLKNLVRDLKPVVNQLKWFPRLSWRVAFGYKTRL